MSVFVIGITLSYGYRDNVLYSCGCRAGSGIHTRCFCYCMKCLHYETKSKGMAAIGMYHKHGLCLQKHMH